MATSPSPNGARSLIDSNGPPTGISASVQFAPPSSEYQAAGDGLGVEVLDPAAGRHEPIADRVDRFDRGQLERGRTVVQVMPSWLTTK